MMQPRSLFILVLPMLFLGGCSKPQQSAAVTANADADRAAIDRGHEAFLAGMRANDCNALLPLLTADVVFAPPNATTATGLDGVRAWCEPIFKQVKTTAVTVSDRDVDIAGDWAIEHGNFDWTVAPLAGGSEQREQGRFLAIYRRQPDGSWKMARDIWNSSLPLPSAAPK
jgi:uncharacterized protein (TIGR02246 family)